MEPALSGIAKSDNRVNYRRKGVEKVEIPKLDVDCPTGLCFACGQDNPIGLKLKPVYDGEKVRAEFTPGELYQGWNDTVHGGIIYTLLDEITAYAILCCGVDFGVTAKSEVRFRHVAPINEPIQLSAWVTKFRKRLVEVEGVLTQKNNTVIAEGSFLFYVWRQSNKTILWDLDGVIVDSGSYHFSAWQETFAKRGVMFTQENFVKLFGARNDFIIHNILGDKVHEDDINTIAAQKESNFRNRIKGNIKLLPGVLKLLEIIKKGHFKMSLVSSAAKENIDLLFGELGLEDYFSCIISGRDVTDSKPSPQIFLLAAEKCETKPENCIVIEDSPLGVKAAKAAGMRCLAVSNAHSKRELAEADRIVNSLEEVDLIDLLYRV